MLTIAYYFLQVVLCSGMLMGYYWLVLRNKRFHQYNRFYLLAAALLSWIVPLIKITWNRPLLGEEQQVMNILSVVADNNSQIEATFTRHGFIWNWDLLVSAVYFSVALVLLVGLVRAFVKLYRLLKQHSCKNVGDVFLILTQAEGTPFSFFRYIFWNEEIDIRSEAGQQILKHELTHVQQKHSFDKLFIQVMLIGGWFNPFFWLLRREMELIHEFIADKKAVNNGDTSALAQMLLTAAYPQQKFTLTHPFFFSPIKRRLLMLANNKNPRFSYIRRLVVLPLLAIVIVLFAFRGKEQRESGELSVASIVENYKDDLHNVLLQIEPVHPPDNSLLINGKKFSAETISIKDLKYAPYILELTDEKKITSETNKVSFVPLLKMDVPDPLFLINGKKNTRAQLEKLDPSMIEAVTVLKNTEAVALYGAEAANGVVLVVLKQENVQVTETTDDKIAFPNISGVAKDASGNVAKNRKVFVEMIFSQGEEKTIFFEEQHETTTDNEGAFTVKMGNGNLLYSSRDLNSLDAAKGPYFISAKTAIQPSVQMGSWKAADNYIDLLTIQVPVKEKKLDMPHAVYSGMRSVGSFLQTDKDMNVNWGKTSEVKIVATNSPRKQDVANTADEAVLNEVTVVGYGTRSVAGEPLQGKMPARFPGGKDAWDKFLLRNLNRDILKNNKAPFGKYIVLVDFVVDKDGSIGEVKASNDPGYGMKAEAERIISKTPNWVPATDEKGQAIVYKQRQPVTFIYTDVTKPILTEVRIDKVSPPKTTIDGVVNVVITAAPEIRDLPSAEVQKVSVPGNGNRVVLSGTTTGGVAVNSAEPSFPGGQPAWSQYLFRTLKNYEPASKGTPPGKYTVSVSFTVGVDGAVSNVRADNDPGYGISEQGIRVIEKGPNWIPGSIQGKPVTARHRVSITLAINVDKRNTAVVTNDNTRSTSRFRSMNTAPEK